MLRSKISEYEIRRIVDLKPHFYVRIDTDGLNWITPAGNTPEEKAASRSLIHFYKLELIQFGMALDKRAKALPETEYEPKGEIAE